LHQNQDDPTNIPKASQPQFDGKGGKEISARNARRIAAKKSWWQGARRKAKPKTTDVAQIDKPRETGE
jgi:hypothetical protein